MKKMKVLKIFLVATVLTTIIFMASNVFAVSEDDLYLDMSNSLNTDTNNVSTNTTNTNTENTSLNLTTKTNNTTTNVTNSNSNYNTNLPKTGAESNTMIGVGITLLAILAVFTYKKVKEYKNI